MQLVKTISPWLFRETAKVSWCLCILALGKSFFKTFFTPKTRWFADLKHHGTTERSVQFFGFSLWVTISDATCTESAKCANLQSNKVSNIYPMSFAVLYHGAVSNNNKCLIDLTSGRSIFIIGLKAGGLATVYAL